MKFTVVIPARYASSRFPGKPLADISGKPMVVRVAERAAKSGASQIIVATDDARIAGSIANELRGLIDNATSNTKALTALPKPKDFADVKAGMDVANKALDDVARLTGGGNFAQGTIKALEAREASLIELRNGETVGCGDGARLALIDRAKAIVRMR